MSNAVTHSGTKEDRRKAPVVLIPRRHGLFPKEKDGALGENSFLIKAPLNFHGSLQHFISLTSERRWHLIPTCTYMYLGDHPLWISRALSVRLCCTPLRCYSMTLYRRSIRIVGATLVVYALLVATHLGEFWPFSIYPMFSQAGNPWTRAVVRTVPDDAEAVAWKAVPFSDLPGNPYPVAPKGINQNDVANYVSKTSAWTEQRVRGFRSLFESSYDFEKPLLVMKVRGALTGDSVSIQATPVMLLEGDTTRFSPSVPLAPSLEDATAQATPRP